MTRALTIRSTAVRWWVPAVAVVVVLALVQLTGGFATVSGARGRAAEVDTEITLARWTLVVHAAELLPGNEYEPEDPEDVLPDKVLVRVRATFTGERSTYGLGTDLVTVQGPLGTAPLDDSPSIEGDRSGDFDPDVPQDITLVFRWPDAPTTSPGTIRLLIRDEEEKGSYLFSAPEWGARAMPSVHLDLPCPDRRADR